MKEFLHESRRVPIRRAHDRQFLLEKLEQAYQGDPAQGSPGYTEIEAALLSHAKQVYWAEGTLGVIAGAIAFQVQRDCVFIDHVGSLEPGIGSKLVKIAEDQAKRLGVSVNIVPSNAAKKWWENRGYRASGPGLLMSFP